MFNNNDIKFLLIDDDKDNLFILRTSLKGFGFTNIAEVGDGYDALEYLKVNPDIDIILLDRMMPKLDGIETFKHIKKNKILNHIDVIYQTGKTSVSDIQECVDAGGYYMLKKPFRNKEFYMFISQISSKRLRRLYFNHELLTQHYEPINLDKLHKEFYVKTPEQAKQTALQIALYYKDPLYYVEAIYQIILNAIEHGNAGTGYYRKRDLLENKLYHSELEKILSKPEIANKSVQIIIRKFDKTINLLIKDEGTGFRYNYFNAINVENITEPIGKGIIYSKTIFDELNYNNVGNEVTCVSFID
jgi:CheY-like chemotaxis protein